MLWAAPGSLAPQRIAEAWERSGTLADLADVAGPWAVVLWDPTTSEHLMVSDPLGVQPLYWARTGTAGFAASSWLEPLLDRPDVDDTIDYEGLLLDSVFLLHGESMLERTRFASVKRVPWGRAVRIRGDRSARVEQYWDPSSLPGPDPSLSLHDAAELLRDRIDAAIRRLTPTDRPVASHVSGGLDCTAVACRANQVLAESGRSLVAGYSWSPDEQTVPRFAGDERALLDDVSSSEALDIRTVHPDETGDWFFARDPDRYPQNTQTYERFVLPRARNDGVDVMLSGWGGDELASFNGRAVSRDLARRGRLGHLWDVTTRGTTLHDPDAGIGRHVRVFGATLFAAAPEPLRDLRHPLNARARRTRLREMDALLRASSPFAADVLRDRLAAFERATDHHEYQLTLLTGGHLQRRCDDWFQTGRLFDVSYRYPLLDLGVVTAALQLPWWAFRSRGWTRTAFRMAIEPWVPKSVAWNTSKSEPALRPTSGQRVVRHTPPAPMTVRPDDDRYQATIELAHRVNMVAMGGAQALPQRPVRARPDAAPRR
jgi:asparagine synthase (glutamine-hydrolysing)